MADSTDLAPEWQEQKEKRQKLVVPEGMSKRAFKRQLKLEKLEAEREDFVAKRKEKRKQLRESKKRERDTSSSPGPSAAKKIKHEPEASGVGVVLDCGFDDLMTEGERTSLARQLVRCYSENRRAPLAVDLTVTGFNGHLKDRFENRMHSHHLQWQNITFSDQDEIKANGPILYLSSDSDEVLSELAPGTTYVIGGIVDKGRYKDLCKDKAEKLGIPTARLPIGEHIRLSGRRVLATNHVFELMLRWLELKDWKQAFEAVLPSRKVLGEKSTASTAAESATPESSTESPAGPPAESVLEARSA